MPSRIIVLGMFRSGTSLSTRLVQQWGAYAGPEEDLFGDRYGYLEHLGLQKLNDDLMEGNERVPPEAARLAEQAREPQLRRQAIELLESMDRQAKAQGARAWVWKDPRLPMALPFWAEIWEDVIYVIPVRNPIETIQSGANMEGVPAESAPLSAGFAYWQYNMLKVLEHTQPSRRKIFIAFDQLIRSPLEQCARLCRFLDAQTGEQSHDEVGRLQKLAALVQAGERHYQETRSLAELAQSTREQRALYDLLRVKTLYPDEAYNQDDLALYPGWREYLQAMDMLLSASSSHQG